MKPKDKLEGYITVAERIEQFYKEHPQGKIKTKILEHDIERGFVLMRAKVYRNQDDASASATGHAYEYRDAGYVQKTSYIEVCECVPLDTKILTINGFKAFDHVQVGELIASYDQATERIIWEPLERISVYPDQPIKRLFNKKGFEVFCTSDHTWPVEFSNGVNIKKRMRKSSELKKCDRLIINAPCDLGFLEVTPQQASLMGWLITDGWFSRPSSKQLRIGIAQSKVKNFPSIQAALSGVSHSVKDYPGYERTFPSGKTYQCLPSRHWTFKAEGVRNLFPAFQITHEDQLPSVVAQLKPEARQAMLDSMMAGDGFGRRFGKKNRPWVMEVLAILCSLQGIALNKIRHSSVGSVPVQSLRSTRHLYASALQFEEAGRCDVWCPTVGNGTWVARFANGVTVITGNTSAAGRALALLGYEIKRGIASREEMQKVERMNQAGTQAINAAQVAEIKTLALRKGYEIEAHFAKKGTSVDRLSAAEAADLISWLAQKADK